MKAKNFQKEELGESDFEQLVIETVTTVFLPGGIVTLYARLVFTQKTYGERRQDDRINSRYRRY